MIGVESVKKQIWNDDKEYLVLVEDLLSNPKIKELSKFVHHYFTNRLEHSLLVSYRSYLIAKKMGLDYRSVARAGILHDFYLMTTKEVEGLGRGSHNNLHPKLALENAKSITSINHIEEDIILKHMFGVSLSTPPKYKESLIVSMIDKYVAIEEVFSPVRSLVSYYVIIKVMRFNLNFAF